MGTMGPEIAEPKTPQDRLSSYFDDSVATVRQKFTRYAPQLLLNPPSRSFNRTYGSFERGYVLPIVDLITVLFSAYPISFVSFFSASLNSVI